MITTRTLVRRAARWGASLALVSLAAAAARADDVDQALQSLQQAAGAPLTVRRSPTTGLATFVSAPAGRTIASGAARAAGRDDRALAFVDRAAGAFGLRGRQDVAVISASGPDEVGIEHVRLQQLQHGVPVRGSELIVHLRGAGVTAANGKTLPDAAVDTKPTIDAGAASAAAATLMSQQLGVDKAELSAPRLELLNRGFLSGAPSQTRLTWFVEARAFAVREAIWVDAADASILLHFSQIAEALSRSIYTAGGTMTLPGTLMRSEGGLPTGDSDADLAYNYSGDTYTYYATQHGRDSYNNAGAPLISTVHYCEGSCPYANAFWDGTQMVYGDGFSAADDVDAHELTHAVTESSAGLIYCGLSGALNESFSDVFGETVDLGNGAGTDTPAARWFMGEDVPGFGALRNMMDPTIFGDPDKTSSGNFVCNLSCADYDNGGVHFNSGVPNHAYALMADGGTYNSITVAGIGLVKAGKIQYRTLTSYLTPISDFSDDYSALQQSCLDLIGTAGITAGDCTEVTKALDAVELGAPVCVPVCGDGVTTGTEECDDGGLVDGDGCDSNCTFTGCGNGIPTSGEACDDGNATNGDGCDVNCTVSACGNGVTAGTEACDDGNATPNDGCEADCTLSPNCQFYAATDLPQPIFDFNDTVSSVNVAASGVVTMVRVLGLRGTHTYLGDLTFDLYPPAGPPVSLINRACGSQDDFDLDISDDGGAFVCPATDGLPHQPATPLSALNGLPANGTWTLDVRDNAGADSGSLLGWGLLICATPQTCPSAPNPLCRTAQKSMLLMKNGAGTKDKLLWKWIKGGATNTVELSDPTAYSTYQLCLYSGLSGTPLGDLTVPADVQKWAASPTGYKYKDKAGTADGVSLIVAKASPTGKSKAVLKASGANLSLPPLGALSLPITVQLNNASQNLCWGSTFDLGDVSSNDPAQFKAKAQ